MNQLLKYPEDRSYLFRVAKKYVEIYVDVGDMMAAMYYSREKVPDQLKDQLKNLIQEEFNKRGLEVHVKK